MRVLFALIITHCFGCVILEGFNGEFVSQNPTADAGRDNFGENSGVPRIFFDQSFADDRVERYERGFSGSQISEDRDKRPSFANDPVAEDRLSNLRFRFGAGSLLQARHERKASFHARRTLGLDRNFEKELAHGPRRPSDSGLGVTKRKNPTIPNSERNARREDPDDWDDDADSATEDDGGENAGEWDAWTEWSECSASCGCGRQVRWQHCVGKGCAFGLKRAQIRTCHLKDCNTKNLLSWLGMKA